MSVRPYSTESVSWISEPLVESNLSKTSAIGEEELVGGWLVILSFLRGVISFQNGFIDFIGVLNGFGCFLGTPTNRAKPINKQPKHNPKELPKTPSQNQPSKTHYSIISKLSPTLNNKKPIKKQPKTNPKINPPNHPQVFSNFAPRVKKTLRKTLRKPKDNSKPKAKTPSKTNQTKPIPTISHLLPIYPIRRAFFRSSPFCLRPKAKALREAQVSPSSFGDGAPVEGFPAWFLIFLWEMGVFCFFFFPLGFANMFFFDLFFSELVS